jgi:ribonuclease HII
MKAHRDLLHFERALWERGVLWVAGIDEAGRGPLAGPVVAAAVIFPPDMIIPGVDDSKKLTPAQREELYPRILNEAMAVGIGSADPEEIDQVNILQATYRAMHRAVAGLDVAPQHLLIDGNRFDGMHIPFTVVVGGDARSHAIAAASIVAKVTRDRMMVLYDGLYPGYGFARHKGYGTTCHRENFRRLGPCPIHRQSFLRKIYSERLTGGTAPSHAGPDVERKG